MNIAARTLSTRLPEAPLGASARGFCVLCHNPPVREVPLRRYYNQTGGGAIDICDECASQLTSTILTEPALVCECGQHSRNHAHPGAASGRFCLDENCECTEFNPRERADG